VPVDGDPLQWTRDARAFAVGSGVGAADGSPVGLAAGPWVEAVASDLRVAGVPADALHVEQFTW